MAISYKEIRSERQWRASIGLTEDQFHRLVKLFGKAYEEIFDESLDSRQEGSSSESTFKTYEDLLFFGLYSIKSGLTYDWAEVKSIPEKRLYLLEYTANPEHRNSRCKTRTGCSTCRRLRLWPLETEMSARYSADASF